MLSQGIVDRFSTPEFLKFLDDGAGLGPESDYFTAMQSRNVRYADATITAIYHRLAHLLERCHTLVSVRPLFDPEINHKDRKKTNLFVRLELTTTEEGDLEHTAEYGYEQYPASFDEADRAAYDQALQACEGMNLAAWNDVHACELFNKQIPYDTIAQIEGDMREDVGVFVNQVAKWALDNALSPPGDRPPTPRL